MLPAVALLLIQSIEASEACRACHPAIVAAYAKTGMGRSIDERPAPFFGQFYHRLSNRHYVFADGKLRRHQIDAGQRTVNVMEKTVDFAIGSGNHAVTYISRTSQGNLIQLPVSWYRDRNGLAMSPGYDRPDHFDMRREISDACLFCHAAYSSDRTRPKSIDCERCHGPVAAHLAKPERGNVVNPKRLEPARQLEVCLQCHLETVSQGIIDSMRRPGRQTFSYRPGEPLASYKLYFDRADAPAERFEVNHAGYRLLHSACFQRSNGRLTCTRCHDPHTAKARNACADCHSSAHAKAASDCAGCHMPKRRTQDAIHVTMTDHWIQTRPEFTNPEREVQTPYSGRVIGFHTAADSLTLSLVNIREPSAEAVAIYRRHLSRNPADTATMAALGNAEFRLGRIKEARKTLEAALRADPGHAGAGNTLGVLLATQGDHKAALAVFERSRNHHPEHSLSWMNIAVTHQAMGNRAQAETAFREAIRLQPDFAEARQRLAALLAEDKQP